jgi:pimeloyl-ACP methyl ester carboxylesterase
MATYVLIHGAWHGAWCWDFVKPELEKEGHKVITPNLPIDTEATLIDYAKFVVNEIDEEWDPIVVGHSMAGLLLPLIAENTIVRRLVYLCAVLRRAGCSLAEDHEDGVNPGLTIPGFEQIKVDENDGFSSLKKEAMPYFYADCTEEIQKWAFSNLRKQHSYWKEENPQEEWPEVSSASIICTEDKAIDPHWSEQVARDWLNVRPITLSASHSPFLSHPKKLAEILLKEI